MESYFVGHTLRLTLFGGSHEEFVGATLEGFPAGIPYPADGVRRFMARRAPGRGSVSSARKEADEVNVVSGFTNGVSDGSPVMLKIMNTDVRRADYEGVRLVPRPSHADFCAYMKYGPDFDMSGGGHFSGRMTAPVCAVGALLLSYLENKGVTVGAHILQTGNVFDTPFDRASVGKDLLLSLAERGFPVIDADAGEKMKREVMTAAADKDSVGGVVECAAVGVACGFGGPAFEGIDGELARAVFGIPGVRGFDIGAGFGAAAMRGSMHNDPFFMSGENVLTKKNDHGGVLGGITSGMPVVFRAAIKPTPSIGKEQQSVSLSSGTDVPLTVVGRHDPCIVPRAVPCVEAVTALVLADHYITYKNEKR